MTEPSTTTPGPPRSDDACRPARNLGRAVPNTTSSTYAGGARRRRVGRTVMAGAIAVVLRRPSSPAASRCWVGDEPGRADAGHLRRHQLLPVAGTDVMDADVYRRSRAPALRPQRRRRLLHRPVADTVAPPPPAVAPKPSRRPHRHGRLLNTGAKNINCNTEGVNRDMAIRSPVAVTDRTGGRSGNPRRPRRAMPRRSTTTGRTRVRVRFEDGQRRDGDPGRPQGWRSSPASTRTEPATHSAPCDVSSPCATNEASSPGSSSGSCGPHRGPVSPLPQVETTRPNARSLPSPPLPPAGTTPDFITVPPTVSSTSVPTTTVAATSSHRLPPRHHDPGQRARGLRGARVRSRTDGHRSHG